MDKNTQLGFIHGFIPPNKVSGSRTLLLLHGTGGSEEDMLPLGKQIAPEAAILSPRGKVLENGMPRFFRRLAEGVFDIEDLKFRTYELADFVEQASRIYGFDLQHVSLSF
jgi:predicted esterase